MTDEERTWDEFRATGLLWWINKELHTFGWEIAVKYDEGIVEAVPLRTEFRGFDEETNTEGYQKVAKYLAENADELLKESME